MFREVTKCTDAYLTLPEASETLGKRGSGEFQLKPGEEGAGTRRGQGGRQRRPFMPPVQVSVQASGLGRLRQAVKATRGPGTRGASLAQSHPPASPPANPHGSLSPL